MQIDLTGRTALVTGATGQLGRVMARTLAACGADVAIHYRQNEAKALELQREIRSMDRRAVITRADVTDASEVEILKETVLAAFGRLDILVANAVSSITWHSILEQSVEDYLDQFQSCVVQSILLGKAFIPQMIDRGYGRIIGINTECSALLDPGASAYSAAKRAMDGLYRILAKEIGQHQITVNQIAPGWTVSDRDREHHTERQEAYEARVPLRRRGTDQEIANVVAFIASDLAGFITGAYVPVSGGTVMPAI